jgi:hypothetical protein
MRQAGHALRFANAAPDDAVALEAGAPGAEYQTRRLEANLRVLLLTLRASGTYRVWTVWFSEPRGGRLVLSPWIRRARKPVYESLHVPTLFRRKGLIGSAKIIQQLACMLGCAGQFASVTCTYSREESLIPLVLAILGHKWGAP